MTEKVGEGGPKRNASSAKQSRGQNVWSVIQSNILGYPINKNTHHESTGQREVMHHESTGQREVMKYLRKNCYHCIEYSAANSLTALMWK